jgi:hypothetical protein
MKTSEFIRKAVAEYLGEGERLCHALGMGWAFYEDVTQHQFDTVRSYLLQLMAPYCCLENWLLDYGYNTDSESMYHHRLMWAEWVAQQYETRGD